MVSQLDDHRTDFEQKGYVAACECLSWLAPFLVGLLGDSIFPCMQEVEKIRAGATGARPVPPASAAAAAPGL